MLRTRIRFKIWFGRILGVIVLAGILLLAYFNNKLLETIISIICFYIFRFMFLKQYHSFNSIMCACVSLLVYFLIIKLEFNLSESILFSVILTFMVNLISYYVKEFIDTRNEIKLYREKQRKMMTKRLEELSEEELLRLLPNIKKNIIHIAYGYIHRDKGITAIDYAYDNNISEPLVYKYVKQVKDEYKNLINL